MGIEDYHVEGCLGKGTFGDVFKAYSKKDNTIVAIKVISLDDSDDDISNIVREIQFLSRMRSEYITKYYETLVIGMDLWIVMEYCGGGSCHDLLQSHGKLGEEITAYIIKGVLRGLSYLHGQSKVHRDIKLANILITLEGKIKLADFGVSGEITMTHLKRNTFVGTPFWMAPEVLTRSAEGYDEKADIWSTGITAIELVTGLHPFGKKDPVKYIFEIAQQKPPTLTGINFSENIKDFVRYCLIKDPTKRPSCSTLLHHKFITNIKRHTTILPLLEEHKKWLSKVNFSVRPRRDFNFKEDEDYQLFEWDFSTTSRSTKGASATRKISPMVQTLIYHTKSESETNNTMKSLNNLSGDLHPPSGDTPASSPRSQYSYNDYLIYCLERVRQRAIAKGTKDAVRDLINVLSKLEGEQPGLSEAIIEEVIKFKYLMQK